ncbi:MAG: alkaline phosphatase family protein [Halobacteria archaeon]
MEGRVLVLGLDGADWSILRPLLPELPNLRGLVESGLSGPLRSTLLPITPPAWSTFLTGRNPGAHGIFDHFKRKPGSYDIEPVHRGHLAVPALWDLLAAAGVPQAWVNVPMSWPPPPVNGVVVSGWPAWPGSEFTSPPEFARSLGDYPLHATEVAAPGNLDRFAEEQIRVIGARARALRLALGATPGWRFAMVHFEAPDETHHACYGDAGRMLPVYRALDGAVGEILGQAPSGTRVMVASDHGAAPLRWFLHLNPWLRERGLLRLRGGAGTALKAGLSRAGLTPEAAYRLLLRGGLGGLRRLLPPERERGLLSRLFISFRDVEWERTLAYSVGYGGQVYLNRKGREPRGTVRDEDAEEVLARVEAGLWLMRDPEAPRPLVTEVHRGRDIYSGPRARDGPDLLFLTEEMATVGFGRFEFASSRPLARPFGIRSSHSMEGVVALAGPGIGRGSVAADLRDCAPTILRLLGLGVPGEMEGRPLAGEGDAAPPAPAAPAPVAQADHPAVLERLRRLGYLG